MQKIGIIIGNTNTLILKDKSLLRYTDLKKELRKRFILRPRVLICTDRYDEEEIKLLKKEIRPSKIDYIEKAKAILIGKKIDINKSSVFMVINIEDNINIGIVSLGKVIINKDIDIKDSVDEIVDKIKKELDELRIEIVAYIKETGIILSGNNSILKELSTKLRKELDIPIFLSEDSSNDCVEGIKILLDE
jgi:actin-like ATPase involved in cell morphogenesis